MPKLKETGAAGCVVSGEMQMVDGTPDASTVKIVPDRPQVWRGRLISAKPIMVQADSTGRFEVTLPPGLYSLEMATMTVRIRVPDAASALVPGILV